MNTTPAEYGELLLLRWRWVVWGMLLTLLATTVVLLVSPPVYRSEATVFVRTPGDISRVQDGGDLYARARTGTYAALAKSAGVSSPVIADLGLGLTPEALSRRIAADPRAGTALLDLAVSAPSALEAERTATVLLSELGSTVRDLESVPGSLVPRAELVVVDPPRRPVRVTAFGMSMPMLLFGVSLLGAVLGALTVVIRSAFSASAPVADPAVISADHPDSGGAAPSSSIESCEPAPMLIYTDAALVADVGRLHGRHRHRRRRRVPAQSTEGHE